MQFIKRIFLFIPFALLLNGCGIVHVGTAASKLGGAVKFGAMANVGIHGFQIIGPILIIIAIGVGIFFIAIDQHEKNKTKQKTQFAAHKPIVPKQENTPKETLTWDEPPKVEEKKVEPIKTEVTITAEEEEKIYADVAKGLKENRREGLWTKGFAECGGDEKKTKLYYVKNRVKALMEELKESKKKN